MLYDLNFSKKYYSRDSIRDDEIGDTFGMHVWERLCLEAFVKKKPERKNHIKSLYFNGRLTVEGAD